MNEKQIHSIFDSSVRKLRKIIGTEASLVSVASKTKTDPVLQDAMAMCHSKINWDTLDLAGILHINTKMYMETAIQYELKDEALTQCIQNTACHEMAHYLVIAKNIRFWRNKYAHDQGLATVYIGKFFEEYNERDLDEVHGKDWKSFMEEFGAKHTPYRWSLCSAPKIFAR